MTDTVLPSLKFLSLVFFQASISIDFRCPDKRFFWWGAGASKSQKHMLSVRLNLNVHVVNDEYCKKTHPQWHSNVEIPMEKSDKIMLFICFGSQTVSKSVFC